MMLYRVLMQPGVIAVSQIEEPAARIDATGLGRGLRSGFWMALPLLVTPKIRFCNSGSLREWEGVRSLIPGVM